jgi:hypothetical protein
VALGLFCGIRVQELCRMRISDLQLESHDSKPYALLEESITKTKHPRNVRIPHNCYVWLNLWLDKATVWVSRNSPTRRPLKDSDKIIPVGDVRPDGHPAHLASRATRLGFGEPREDVRLERGHRALNWLDDVGDVVEDKACLTACIERETAELRQPDEMLEVRTIQQEKLTCPSADATVGAAGHEGVSARGSCPARRTSIAAGAGP